MLITCLETISKYLESIIEKLNIPLLSNISFDLVIDLVWKLIYQM